MDDPKERLVPTSQPVHFYIWAYVVFENQDIRRYLTSSFSVLPYAVCHFHAESVWKISAIRVQWVASSSSLLLCVC
jgi:hypothetical protein